MEYRNDMDDFPGDYPDEAIPLIIFNDEKRKFEINEEGRQFLSQLRGPLGIVAVAGMYRTGKSYLLNRMLLNRSDGFGVGPTINPCTKGVWMWSRPVEGQTPDGDPIKVLIMDTEGLGALDEDSNHDVRIFSLAILLSSFFIYNSVGSIDENALQNLNLVVNLTKHIQIKSSGVSEELDPQEFAKYFPSFMWVVRDFTLQLVDQEGDPINAKEYLEKALQNQKGFSEAVDQKNRIRRLLKSFFADRDCVTMIRPLTNEDQLQNLINIPLEKLRPEFVEQVHILRRKVLHRVKPKTINGKTLNGDMFWNLCRSYVEAINAGAIPSIENSWAYICKNECLKALDEAVDMFNRTLQSEVSGLGPLDDDELKEKYSKAKRVSLEYFQKVAVGEVKAQFQDQLRDKMKQRYDFVKNDNAHLCEQESIMFLRQQYTEIERALKNMDYPRLIDYLQDVMKFKGAFEEYGPPGSNRREILLDFCLKAVMEAAEFFLSNTMNDMNLQRALAEENIKKLQQQIDEYKNENKNRIEHLEQKIRRSEIQKAEAAAREQSTREHLQQLQQDKNQLEKDFDSKLQTQKKDFERQLEEMAQKAISAEDAKKELQRQQVSVESEFDKQKALFEQKIEFLEKALEESGRREKEISVELKNCKKDFLNQSKETTTQLEKQIKDISKQLEELKETNYEQETKISDLEIQLEEQKNKAGDEISMKSKELSRSRQTEADLQRKYEQLMKKYEQDCVNLKESHENENKLKNDKINDLDNQLKDTKETFDLAKQNWSKEEAVLKQKLEFCQFQLDEEKKKSDENKKAHESMLKSLQSSNRESVIGREEAQQRINEMEQKFLEERKHLDEQHAESRQRLAIDLENLKKKHNELELDLKLKEGEFEKEIQQLKEQLCEAEATRDLVNKQLKTLDSANAITMAKNEEEFKNNIIELERQLDEKEQEIEELIKEHNENSEQKLNEIKRFYEDERERIERRGTEERARFDKKLASVTEEYEDRINEMRNNHEDALNNLLEEKNDLEQTLLANQNQLDKENQSLHERLENKERQLTELKEAYNSLQANASRMNELNSEKFAKERRDLNDRLDQLTSEVSKRDRQILSLENQKDGFQGQLAYKDKMIEELRQEAVQEKQNLVNKLDEVKAKLEETVNELTQSKINFEREKALKEQKIAFQEQRIGEYNDQMKQTIDRYEERLKQEKEDFQKTLQERIARIQSEKESVDKKYEQKRKAMKDLEKLMQQTVSQNERETAVLNEKHENLERQQKELIKSLEVENQRLQEQIEELNEALAKGDLGIRDEVEEWRAKFHEIDRQHCDLQTEFEKEKALWQGKFDFLEKQKEKYKKDNEDAHQLFQQTVDQLQRDQKDTKQRHDANHTAVLSNLEQKFKKELRDTQEMMATTVEKLQNQINKLEKEKKQLKESLEISSKNLMSEQGGLEKKLERLLEDKERLTKELDTVKTDRDKKLEDLKRQFEREKETLKIKNNELQQKSKAIETKQTELILSHETNRAKWDQEKSYLLSAKEDAVQEQKALQRKNENLMKEIERVKEQQKRNNYRYTKPGQPGVTTGAPALQKIETALLGRLNLGGAGAGLSKEPQNVNQLLQSTNNLNLGAAKGEFGGLGTYRSNFGVDKSMDNLKLGFSKNFGAQLGLGGNKFGDLSSVSSKQDITHSAVGAVVQPSRGLNKEQLDTSIRNSNILSTPSSKGGQLDDDDEN